MEDNNLIICGRNAVTELLNSDKPPSLNALYVQNEAKGLGSVISIAKNRGLVVKEVGADKLDRLCDGNRHGGVAIQIAAAEYTAVDDILKTDKPFVLITDGIEDPHNLGALIRTAEAAGVDGVIIPKRRNAQITAAVYTASAGAAAHVKIARVTNLAETLKSLKNGGLWVYGAEADGTAYSDIEFDNTGGIALVIGSEGRGLSRLVRDNCDFVVSIPMLGKINSLNASVSGGILMFHIANNRQLSTVNCQLPKGGGRD
ncbi:MAG: 23S rRNA (guanosine(2251)-2'-O)-methyltransferase RlmB [Oscillospiraceae bacterium]|nr:23S rRNA (guanosine(2251)-2'-O)-methyltransferase RlmB [Oscillospiraceae bacterium]